MPASNPSHSSSAQARSQLAQAWQDAEAAEAVVLVTDLDAPPGWACWEVGGSRTVLPALSDDAPPEVRDRYISRIRANCQGRCPECGEAAGVSVDPEQAPAAWQAIPVVVACRHSFDCPALFTEAERRYFPVFNGELP